jgi:hypothetical protein
MNNFSYSNLNAYTLVPEPNGTYLSRTANIPIANPLSGSTMGLMMLLSTFQYQASSMGTYSNAATQASKAAAIVSGEQDMQDRFIKLITNDSKDAMHSVGITDTEAGIVLETAKTIKNKQLQINGPKIYLIKSKLTIGQDNASIGLGYNFE